MNSQFERTRLAWRRTILAVLAVAGLGALHLALAGAPIAALLVLTAAAAGSVLGLTRLASLSARRATATWQPVALTVTTCLISLSVLASRA